MILCDNQICDDREPCVPIVTHKNSVFLHTVDADDDAFSIHILEIQMVIVQYSHTEDVDDDGLVADVLTKPLS